MASSPSEANLTLQLSEVAAAEWGDPARGAAPAAPWWRGLAVDRSLECALAACTRGYSDFII